MKKIVIVEDDPVISSQLADFLMNNGYDCSSVTDYVDCAEQVLAEEADNFIAKPYNPAILLLHIEAVFKRLSHPSEQTALTCGSLRLDRERGILYIREEEVDLTKNEMKILVYLMKHQGKIVARDELISYLWDTEEFVDDNTLTVNVNRVRTKLREYGVEDLIRTKRGIGYVMG